MVLNCSSAGERTPGQCKYFGRTPRPFLRAVLKIGSLFVLSVSIREI